MRRFKFKLAVFYVLLYSFFIVLTISCHKTKSINPNPETHNLISFDHIKTVPKSEIQDIAQRAGGTLLKLLVRSGVDAYRIVYNTVSPEGNPVTASGLILMTDHYSNSNPLDLLGITHATILNKEEAPSKFNPQGKESYILGNIIASFSRFDGYLGIPSFLIFMPDYLGYGIDESLLYPGHPYLNADNSARTSYDMLNAVLEFAKKKNILIRESKPDLLNLKIAGYSEGAFAGMALHRLLDDETKVLMRYKYDIRSYLGDGPYDIKITAKSSTERKEIQKKSFIASYVWTLLEYNRFYKINAQLNEIFTEKNEKIISSHLNKGEDLIAQIAYNNLDPTIDLNPAELFTKDFITSIQNETNKKYMEAFAYNIKYDWLPSGRIQLLHAPKDNFVPYANSKIAYESMKKKGAGDNVSIIKLEGKDHATDIANEYVKYLIENLIGIALSDIARNYGSEDIKMHIY